MDVGHAHARDLTIGERDWQAPPSPARVPARTIVTPSPAVLPISPGAASANIAGTASRAFNARTQVARN
jgi:hypothetical protein